MTDEAKLPTVLSHSMSRVLAISGSLRSGSINTEVLKAARILAREPLEIELSNIIGTLPHFNSDLESSLPPAIVSFRESVANADGLLISSPEYARGIPGSLKNALDWLVADLKFPGKPVALISTAARAHEAQAALRLVLRTMSAHIIEDACLTVDLLGQKIAAPAIACTPLYAQPLAAALAALQGAMHTNQASVR